MGQAGPEPARRSFVAQKCAVLKGLRATVIVISETTGLPQVALSLLFELPF